MNAWHLVKKTTDFRLKLGVSFIEQSKSALNERAISWINRFMPFNIEEFLSKVGNVLCNIICIRGFSFGMSSEDDPGFSLIDFMEGTLPSFALDISILNTPRNISTTALSWNALKLSFFEWAGERLRNYFDVRFCILDRNCGDGFSCNKFMCNSKCQPNEFWFNNQCNKCPEGKVYDKENRYCIDAPLRPLAVFKSNRTQEQTTDKTYDIPWYRISNVNIFNPEEYSAAFEYHLAQGWVTVDPSTQIIRSSKPFVESFTKKTRAMTQPLQNTNSRSIHISD